MKALLPLTALAAGLLTIGAASSAEAHSGIYLGLGAGYGSFSGNTLVTQEDPNQAGDMPLIGDGCCPGPGLALNLRLGFSIFGFGGPEFMFMGNGWDLGSNTGGAGFVGGGIRLFPVKFLGLLGLDDEDFPVVIGLGVNFGYSLIGKDFAYTGTYVDLDLQVDYKFTSYFSLGIRFDYVLPNYSDFVFTDYKNDRGRCLDQGGNQQIDLGVMDKGSANCAGNGPSTSFISPQLMLTFHFDVLSGN